MIKSKATKRMGYLSTPLEQPGRGEAEDEAPERRADAEDCDIGHGDQEADERTEAELSPERSGKGRLQHLEHRETGERCDEGRRRAEQHAREERCEHAEGDGEYTEKERRGVVPGFFAGTR